ncbi:MAG TPA: choice-of-anchor Q domain-containing protein, partial [Flavipsychrobacter sp.]|nr:choice-of-anchor Q domain-containing protein [Flavipsychrobacter sp.]
SQFSINVNGQKGNFVKDIEIAPKDSIYVFATVNIDPTDENNPFVLNDVLIATLNGKQYTLPFLAFGQNAYYLVDSLITSNQTWHTDKPYVIIHNAGIDENVTVTIPAGCRIYVHGDSRLLVWGKLLVNGTKQDSVVFQGDRLDRKYFGNEGYPGEWGGMYFFPTSSGSEINYAIIKNVGNSTRLGEAVFTPAAIQLNYDTIAVNEAQLTLRNTIIENSIGHGVLAFGSSLVMENCLVNTTGAHGMVAYEGGAYRLNNSTFVTYGTDKVSHVDVPVMALLNYRDIGNNTYVGGPLQVLMTNCVVWGSLETEFIAQGLEGAPFDVTLENCLVKNKDGMPKDVKATNCKVNEDPRFKDHNNWNYRPAEGSPLINAGINSGINTDLDGKARDGQPDIGCYEY